MNSEEYIQKLEDLIDLQKRQVKTTKLMLQAQEKRLQACRKELQDFKQANRNIAQ